MRPWSTIGAIALGVCTLGVSADSNSTSKRGISFIPETPPSDYDILLSSDSSPITWYYTWTPRPAPEDHIFPWGARSDVEFVPTLHSIGDGDLEKDIEELDSLADSSEHLFTFNEPDGTTDSGGSAITPREAAEAYIEQVVPLRERFRISHPSVTGSERGLEWLREFDSACREIDPESGCPTDFVVAHWYGGLDGLIWWLKELADLYVSGDYGFESEDDFEIWIKELGIPGAPLEANRVMMEQALPYLDGLNYVKKYAWFGTFRPQQANEWTGEGVALFQDDGGLTAIGALYLGGEANGFQVGDRGRDSPQPPEEDDDSNNDNDSNVGDDSEQNDNESLAARTRTGTLATWILTGLHQVFLVTVVLFRVGARRVPGLKHRLPNGVEHISQAMIQEKPFEEAPATIAEGSVDVASAVERISRDARLARKRFRKEKNHRVSKVAGSGSDAPNKSCICFIHAEENPDHPWLVSQADYRKFYTQETHAFLRDRDYFGIIEYTDFPGYGSLEIMQNLFLDFNEAAKRG
ncbi:hypothetical protein DL769_010498 [Monosporascus sp. CRB-8-3]|nr:hypothetical protein DL769_010498 [Monosporascus sp. CRB-8-3]